MPHPPAGPFEVGDDAFREEGLEDVGGRDGDALVTVSQIEAFHVCIRFSPDSNSFKIEEKDLSAQPFGCNGDCKDDLKT